MKSRARGKLAIIGFKLLVVALAGLMLTGCGDALLIATFDDDAVGMPPAAEPKGPPYGDRIHIPTLGREPVETPWNPILMVTPSLENFPGNAARYRNSEWGYDFKYVSFIARDPSDSILLYPLSFILGIEDY